MIQLIYTHTHTHTHTHGERERTLKSSPKNLLELVNEFTKAAGYMINTQRSIFFLSTNTKIQKEKAKKKKKSHLKYHKK